jgi:predicted nucleic-acid-binding protein
LIGLDTNVLVRYITQDDAEQAARATGMIEGLSEEDQGFVSIVTLVEIYWVLRSAYKVGLTEAAKVIATVVDAEEIVVESSDAVRRALGRLDGTFDLADALTSELGRAAGCTYTATLDRRAARLPGMRLLAPR